MTKIKFINTQIFNCNIIIQLSPLCVAYTQIETSGFRIDFECADTKSCLHNELQC